MSTDREITHKPLCSTNGGRVQRASVYIDGEYMCQELTVFPNMFDFWGETLVSYGFYFNEATREQVLAASGRPEGVRPNEYCADGGDYVWYETEDFDHAVEFHDNIQRILS